MPVHIAYCPFSEWQVAVHANSFEVAAAAFTNSTVVVCGMKDILLYVMSLGKLSLCLNASRDSKKGAFFFVSGEHSYLLSTEHKDYDNAWLRIHVFMVSFCK